MRLGIVLAAGALALTAQAAAAQSACDDIKRIFNKPPKIGEWAELRMDKEKDDEKKPTTMRVAFVDRENRGGEQMYRMQMIMTQEDGKRQIMQMLTPWGPDALTKDYDTEVVMKMGDQQAIIMPIKGGKGQPGMADIRKECTKYTVVGDEKVTVPAGTYDTRHYSGPEGDSWVATDVPGWKMVKMVTKKGDRMILTATGAGEKNEITEKPLDMKAMMGGGRLRMPKDKESEEAEAK
jgi:hypothetical protein